MGSSFSDLSTNNNIIGATDNTAIGNVSDSLKCNITNNAESPVNIELAREYKDPYHKLRVTSPHTIFECNFKLSKKTDYFSESTATGGTVTHDTTLRALKLSTTTSSGSKAYYQSYRSFHYVSGKAQLLYIYGLWGAPIANNRKRAGYFNINNGAFFETDGTTMYVVNRSNASGSVVDTRISSANWNIDTLDGNGPSGYIADPTKLQLFIIDFSNGLARFGVLIQEDVIYIHSDFCSNYNTLPSMNSTDLPLRYEIENTGATASASNLYIMNVSIDSEGGIGSEGNIKVLDTGVTAVAITTTNKVVAGIRMNTTACAQGASIKPGSFILRPASGSVIAYYRVILRPTLTSPTWSAFSDITDVLTNNPTYTEGTGIVLSSGYLDLGTGGGPGSGDGSSSISSVLNDKWIGCDIAGTSDALILVVKTVSSSGSVYFSGDFEEYC